MRSLWRNAFLTLLVFTVCGPVLSQTAVAPPPKPADTGPSLAVTMQFIQEKLNQQGRVNYAVYYHDNADGTDWVNQFSIDNTDFIADPAACGISFHSRVINNGVVNSNADFRLTLHGIEDLVVKNGEQDQKRIDADNGHPTWDSKIDPPIFVLVARSREQEIELNFRDEDMANRVAKALLHAVELCGGGNKEPF